MVCATARTCIVTCSVNAAANSAHFKHGATRPVRIPRRRYSDDAWIAAAISSTSASESRTVVGFSVVCRFAIYPELACFLRWHTRHSWSWLWHPDQCSPSTAFFFHSGGHVHLWPVASSETSRCVSSNGPKLTGTRCPRTRRKRFIFSPLWIATTGYKHGEGA